MRESNSSVYKSIAGLVSKGKGGKFDLEISIQNLCSRKREKIRTYTIQTK